MVAIGLSRARLQGRYRAVRQASQLNEVPADERHVILTGNVLWLLKLDEIVA